MILNKYRTKIEEQIELKQREAEYLEVFWKISILVFIISVNFFYFSEFYLAFKTI